MDFLPHLCLLSGLSFRFYELCMSYIFLIVHILLHYDFSISPEQRAAAVSDGRSFYPRRIDPHKDYQTQGL